MAASWNRKTIRSCVEPWFIFVAFLAYCLQVTLKARLKSLATGLTPRAVLEKLATMQMVDVHLPTTDGRELTFEDERGKKKEKTPVDYDGLWWYRNLVGPEHFSIQGYRRSRIYPDFVVQQGRDETPVASVVVVESKGKHLKGSEDTSYKRKVAEYFGKVGYKVPWQKLGKDFQDERFRFQVLDEGDYRDRDWRDELRKQLEHAAST